MSRPASRRPGRRSDFGLTWWGQRGKYWPPVRRIDGAAGDRTLICSCPPVEAYR